MFGYVQGAKALVERSVLLLNWRHGHGRTDLLQKIGAIVLVAPKRHGTKAVVERAVLPAGLRGEVVIQLAVLLPGWHHGRGRTRRSTVKVAPNSG